MSYLINKDFWSIDIPKSAVEDAELSKEEREALIEDLRKLEYGVFEKICVKYGLEF